MFKFTHYALLIFAVVLSSVLSQNVDKNRTITAYLEHYGFMAKAGGVRSEAIKLFQRTAGLLVTGTMDEETTMMMEMPRCGSNQREVIRGPFHGSRFKNRIELTYNVIDYPDYLDRKKVMDNIASAFDEWSRVTNLTFIKTLSKTPKFMIRFSYRPLVPDLDEYSILANAQYPANGGDINFNTIHNWTTEYDPQDSNRYYIYQVALHEIGHSLGLLHSSYPNSVMSPFFMQDSDMRLHPSDVQRIQKLYNINQFASPTFKSNYSICTLKNFDAIISHAANDLTVFKEEKFWKVEAWTDEIIFRELFPRNITEWWGQKAPSNIDAAYVDLDGSTFFFKGSQCWKFGEITYVNDAPIYMLATDFPKAISEVFPGIPNDVDAVMVWQNENVYFFKGSQYWGFNKKGNPPVAASYPKPIKDWGVDIPSDLDAVLYFRQYSKQTYFFKDMLYYKYAEMDMPSIRKYPRPTAFWWFNC